MARLKDRYEKIVKDELNKKFEYINRSLIPCLKKIVINMGVAEAAKDKNIIQAHKEELRLLSGQEPIVTKAKKSVSNFKLREGQPIGLKVTLRGIRMYEFLDRFLNIICPRIRDFRGFPEKCDGHGNYTLGLDDQQIFPELNLDEVKRVQGMHISFVTSSVTDAECLELLRQLGLPFKELPIVVVQ